MLSKSKIRKIVFLFLVFLYAVQLVQAGEQTTLSPDSGHSNQVQINEALENGNVYLNAGVYEVDGPIYIGSDRVLTGDKNAIIRVWSGSSKYFVGLKGVISCRGVVQNVEISNIQLDGNIGNLPSGYANSRSDTDHDCQKMIILHGYSNQFAKNIKIHDLKLYNSFSDGCYILFAESVQVYNNFISNCQHEGFYLSCVNQGLIYNNKIAGICSDAGRLDNCQYCKVYDNYFFSYNGESYGQYKGGQAGLQIANAGSSHGYDASNKPQKTDNIEVYNNIFADPGRQAIWLHNYDGNVFVHDNSFINADVLETMGIPIGDISYENQPSVELSEEVFSSIFDILDMEFTDSGRTEQTADDIPLQVTENTSGIIAGGVKIVGVKDRIVIDNVSYIPDDQAVLVQTKVIQDPDLSQWTGTIKKIDKDVSVKIKNGTAYAILKVKTSWYTQKKDSITGKSKKSKLKTSTATFTDTYSPVPEILTRPSEKKGYINEYRSKSNPNTRIYVDPDGLQKIVYEYGSNTSTHTFLVGEKKADEAGILYTKYTRVNSWDGNISTFDDSIIIYGDFDPSKLKVTCYTPYENFTVTDFEHSIYSMEKNTWISPQTAFILKLFLMLFCGYKLMRVIIPP
ncbi:MAG: right-handed parallel beta-helix repeat-containing protein [Prevotella sp.]